MIFANVIALVEAMASAEADGSKPPQKAVCPSCEEELDRGDEESFPDSCVACGNDLPDGLGVSTCPKCGKTRQTLSSGKPAPFCVCKYNYLTRTLSPRKGTCSHQRLCLQKHSKP